MQFVPPLSAWIFWLRSELALGILTVFWRETRTLTAAVLCMTSLGAANSSATEFYKRFHFKFCIRLCVSPPCEEIKRPPLPFAAGPTVTQGPVPARARHRFRSGKQPFSSWITLWRRCGYALINLNSHRKTPRTTGSLRINLNSSFMSLTQTQLFPSAARHAEGCPATGLCSPVTAPVMLSCSFYRNPNGLF